MLTPRRSLYTALPARPFHIAGIAIALALAASLTACQSTPTAEATAAPVAAAKPAAPAAPPKCNFSYTLGADAAFGATGTALNSAAKKTLDAEVVAKLDKCAEVKQVTISGNTDRTMPTTKGQPLSEKRAAAVAAYLASKGVAKDRIETLGAGKTQPLPSVKCANTLTQKALAACLAPNRRVVIDVFGPAK